MTVSAIQEMAMDSGNAKNHEAFICMYGANHRKTNDALSGLERGLCKHTRPSQQNCGCRCTTRPAGPSVWMGQQLLILSII